MKSLLAALSICAVGGIAATSAVVHRPALPQASAPKVRPVVKEHFAGSAETLTPAELRAARIRNQIEMREWHRQEDERQRAIEHRVAAARARPRSRRLPPDYHWGRCLLVVEGERRISGRCAYSVDKDGSFSIEGPRQIYGGIDYPKPDYHYEERSNDYWAFVFKEKEDGWSGYGNADIRDTHGGPMFGSLRHRDHCWTGETTRICLWRS